MYSEKRVKDYLKELASKSPVPGGGSAAALVGAIGIALLSKVANFTIGKEKYKDVETKMQEILKCSDGLLDCCSKLCSDDAKAYKKLSEVFKLPKGNERQEKLQVALKEAMAVPLDICKSSYEAMKQCVSLAKKGNINLITDVGDATLMLDSAFQSALLNVEINLKSIKDKELVVNTRRIIEPMEREIAAIKDEVKSEVRKYLAK